MPRKAPQYKSLREALVAVITERGPLPAKDAIAEALRRHPLTGATPTATAHAQISMLNAKGVIVKPDRGVVAIAPAPKKRAGRGRAGAA